MLLGEQVGDLILDVVGVLVLVDRDVAKAVLVALEHLGPRAQKLVRPDQEVVEVHGVRRAQAPLELRVHERGLLLGGRRGEALVLLGADEGVLGGGDLGPDHVDRKLLLLDRQRLHDVAHQAARVVIVEDRELPVVAQKVGVLAEHAHAHGVERADPHAARAAREQGLQALAHLGGGLVGEGDGEHLPRAHAEVGDHVRYAVGEHARLAGPRAREHQKRALGREDRLLLRGVERADIEPRGLLGGGRAGEDGIYGGIVPRKGLGHMRTPHEVGRPARGRRRSPRPRMRPRTPPALDRAGDIHVAEPVYPAARTPSARRTAVHEKSAEGQNGGDGGAKEHPWRTRRPPPRTTPPAQAT